VRPEPLHHLLRFFLQAHVGDPGDLDPVGEEVVLAATILLD
jgi:hypothetical protein